MLITGREDLGAGPKSFVPDARHFMLRKGVFSRAAWVLTKTTADATPVGLDWDAENEALLSNAVYGFEGMVVAQYAAAATAAAYRVQGAIKKGAANANTALIGTPLITSYEDTSGMDLGITADTTNGRPILTATGVAATSIVWRAELFVYRLTQTGG
jgi:hypothetical protein